LGRLYVRLSFLPTPCVEDSAPLASCLLPSKEIAVHLIETVASSTHSSSSSSLQEGDLVSSSSSHSSSSSSLQGNLLPSPPTEKKTILVRFDRPGGSQHLQPPLDGIHLPLNPITHTALLSVSSIPKHYHSIDTTTATFTYHNHKDNYTISSLPCRVNVAKTTHQWQVCCRKFSLFFMK